MRFLSAPGIEGDEQDALPREFGLHYAPHGEVGLDDHARLEARGVDLQELEGERLAIEPDTVSWAFLGRREAELLRDLRHRTTFGALRSQWPSDALASPEFFAAKLFRRGLLSIEGQRAVDPRMFRRGPNVHEGRLVELLLTEKCNLACAYCLAGASQKMPHMSEEVATRAIDLAFRMGGDESITFEFSGGEPFLRFGVMQELVRHAREHPDRDGRGVHFCAQTNGTLLDDERVAWAKENSVAIGLSIDGDPTAHDRSRPQVNGRGSFDKVMRGIDLLQRAGIDFGILVVLNRANVGSVDALLDFLIENGIHRLKLNPIAYLGTGRAGWDEFGLTQTEVIDYFQQLARRIVERQVPIEEANLLDMIEHWVSKRRTSRCLRGHCGAGLTFQAIAADGTIYPCGRSTQSPGLALGRVQDDWEALDQPGEQSLVIQQIKERRPKTVSDCVSCSYRELCQSGCPAQAYERSGSVREKTPECTFNKTMYPDLVRWLCFDPRAVETVNRTAYFRGDRTLHIADHVIVPD